MTRSDNAVESAELALGTRPLFSRRDLYALGGILAALFFIGTFFDLQISQALINPTNAFGIFFAAFGEWPATLALVVAGVMLIVFRNPDRPGRAWAQILGGGGLLALGTATTAIRPTMFLDIPAVLVAAIGVLASVLVGFGVIRLSRGVNRRIAVRIAVAVVIAVIAEMILINLIKVGWARPRMRMLVDTPQAVFDPWWSVGHAAQGDLLDAGIAADEFKSFPSGHVANAAIVMLLLAVVALREGLAKHRNLLFWAASAWVGVVVLSRIVVGAHFVTDTVVAFAITLAIVVGVLRVAVRAPKPDQTGSDGRVDD